MVHGKHGETRKQRPSFRVLSCLPWTLYGLFTQPLSGDALFHCLSVVSAAQMSPLTAKEKIGAASEELFGAMRNLPHYLLFPMRFPVRLFAIPCSAACLFATDARTIAEPPKAAVGVPVIAEAVHAPTDLAGLKKMVGRRVVVEGKIVNSGNSSSGSTSYLNFTKNYRDSVSLVFLGASGKAGIPKDQLAAFVGRRIHVGGLIEERNGALQMRVFDVEQIKVLP